MSETLPIEERLAGLRERLSKITTDSDHETIVHLANDLSAIAKPLPKVLYEGFVEALAIRLDRPPSWTHTFVRLPTLHEMRWALDCKPIPPAPRFPGEELYPTTGWLGDYLRWCEGDEAPIGFHFWMGCAVLGAAIGRRAYVDMRRFCIWPNLYLVLVGDPARCKKGQAFDSAGQILDRLNYYLEVANVPNPRRLRLLPEKCTPELAVKMLASVQYDRYPSDPSIEWEYSDSHGIWLCEEMVTLLGKSNHNAAGVLELLTAFFACRPKWDSGTVIRGVEELRNLFLVFCGAATPGWIQSGITEEMFTGGFVSRTMFIHRERSKADYPIPEYNDPIKRDDLAERLLPMVEWNQRVIKMTPRLEDLHDKWYRTDKREQDKILDPHYSHFSARRQIHVLKLAMLLTISEDRTVIDIPDFDLALAILRVEEGYMAPWFQTMGAHNDALDTEYVYKVICRADNRRLKQSELLQNVKWKVGRKQNLTYILDHLKAEGRIRRHQEGSSATIWWEVVGSPPREATLA